MTSRSVVGPFAAVACLFASALVASGSVLVACGNDTAAEEGDEAGSLDASRRDGARGDGGVDTEVDGAPAAPSDVASCKALKAYYDACGGEPLCPLATFDTWCLENTRSADSEAYRLGTIKCATAEHCTADKRKDCMYRSYGTTTQTTVQEQLTTAFCQMCAPTDLAGCTKRTKTYNTVGGPNVVSSEFLAVWELSDAVVEKIRKQCTGSGGGAYDGGADAGACAVAFDKCAGEYFIESLVDCP